MAILTIKLSTEQRDAIAALIQDRIDTCKLGAGDADTYAAQLSYCAEWGLWREVMAELVERARDYGAEAQRITY